jgi:hypothetical protein
MQNAKSASRAIIFHFALNILHFAFKYDSRVCADRPFRRRFATVWDAH